MLYKNSLIGFAKEVEQALGVNVKIVKVNEEVGKKDRVAYEKGKVAGNACEHRHVKKLKH